MLRIISESGTPAKAPEPRGKSPGRLKEERNLERLRYENPSKPEE
ncbi:hypothetical protein QUF90_10450 [Desulfococcaceae bacterium HSG9]|nr:hypothetical protein [Desulfococcaceae bacterium HSG9]